MYAHMFPHTSMETHKSHTYCQIPGYLTLTLPGNTSAWQISLRIAEQKANSAQIYNWCMLLVSAVIHRWL